MGLAFWLIQILLSLSGIAAFGQSPQEWQTRVSPLPGEEILRACEYRMVIPGTNAEVRAAWIVFDRGQDYSNWYADRQVRAFAERQRLAVVLAMHCRSKEREDMIVLPEKGVGRALFTALDQLADVSGHKELKSAGIVALGWSGAGSLVGRLATYRPSRYIAGIAYAPGQYDPLGMDTIELSSDEIRSPQLIIANGGDKVNGTERPYAYFKKYFDRGAPWTFVVQNRLPHCCLQNAQNVILEWLHAVLGAERTTGASSYGYLAIEQTAVLDEWKRPTFNATSGRVGSRGKARRDELPAGWMPSRTFSQEWLTLVGKPGPIAVWRP
jgi:dienelactone hydrolase